MSADERNSRRPLNHADLLRHVKADRGSLDGDFLIYLPEEIAVKLRPVNMNEQANERQRIIDARARLREARRRNAARPVDPEKARRYWENVRRLHSNEPQES